MKIGLFAVLIFQIRLNWSYKLYSYSLEPESCRHQQMDTRLTVLVKSAPGHIARRRTIRMTWGSNNQKIPNFSLLKFFLLGETDDYLIQDLIQDESAIHKDIIQGDFKDTYENLTNKTVLGFQWTTNYCRNTDFVLTTDDDYLISMKNLRLTLERYTRTKELYMGKEMKNTRVKRDKYHKSYVSEGEFPGKRYPPYINGGAVVYSFRTFVDIFNEMPSAKFIRLEDVFIAKIAWNLGIKPKNNRCFHAKFYNNSFHIIAVHGFLGTDLLKFWKLVDRSKRNRQVCK